MPVLKTASPNVSPSAPYASPWKVRPSSRTRIAGLGACTDKPSLLLRLTGRWLKDVGHRRPYQRPATLRDVVRRASSSSGHLVPRRLLPNLLNHRWLRRALCARLETSQVE